MRRGTRGAGGAVLVLSYRSVNAMPTSSGGPRLALSSWRARPERHGGPAGKALRAWAVLTVALTVWRVDVSGAGLGGRGVTCRARWKRRVPTGHTNGSAWGRPQVVGPRGGRAGGGAGMGGGTGG